MRSHCSEKSPRVGLSPVTVPVSLEIQVLSRFTPPTGNQEPNGLLTLITTFRSQFMDENRQIISISLTTRTVGSFALGCGLLLAASAVADDADVELKKFQGTWDVIELVENGKVLSAEKIRELLPSGGRAQVIENAIIFRSPRDGQQHAKTFSIDPAEYPKHIDIGDSQGNRSLGIYQFDQGNLVICVADQGQASRPDNFSADANSQRMRMVLKRGPAVSKPVPQGQTPPPKPAAANALKSLSDSDISKMLPGLWALNDSAGALLVRFRTDGTFSTVREALEASLFHRTFVQRPVSTGTWSVKNGLLTAQVMTSIDASRVNRLFSFDIRSISAADMIFVDPLGRVVRATRVQNP